MTKYDTSVACCIFPAVLRRDCAPWVSGQAVPSSCVLGLRVWRGKGKGKVLGRSPNSSVSVIPTCPKAQHATSYYTHQNSRYSGTVNSRET